MEQRATPSPAHRIHTIELTLVELIAAVARRAHGGQIPRAQAEQMLRKVRSDWLWRFNIVPVSTSIISLAAELASQHGLRGYDALHLAAAVMIDRARLRRGRSPITFLSADQEQLRAAAAEGLAADDPNLHP